MIDHVDEVLKLMSVLTDDRRFEEIIQELPGKGGTSMCTVLDKVENRGIEKGLAQGMAQGLSQGVAQGVAQGREQGLEEGKLEGMTQVYYTKLHYSADQIAEELGTPIDTIQELINRLLKK